jgi:hypothetical protein
MPVNMGRNKQLRKRIAGQLRVIATHQEKIEAELRRPTPDSDYITKWGREIDIARKNVRKLSEQLEK